VLREGVRRLVKDSRYGVRFIWVAAGATALALALAGAARPATGSADPSQTISFDGRPAFPIVLSPPPARGSHTPWGTDALAETASAGVNVFRAGPASGGVPWTSSDIATALALDRAAADLNVHTWVNLSAYSQATPGSDLDAGLAHVVGTLTSDPSGSAIGMWRGRDEPFWSSMAPSTLEFAYCRVTSHGDPAWCGGENPLDPGPPWVTIEAPQGTAADLAPYSSVTDVHGVDVYPVTYSNPVPNLHRVGRWTATLASITPDAPVWTTLQICAGASYDHTTPGSFVLPTQQQERYMAYDAIINGARALAFYGGNMAGCYSGSDAQYGWNWTFWQSVLKPLVGELSASSPIAPALVNDDAGRHISTNDPTTEVLFRRGTSVDDLWLMAARSGSGSQRVTFHGLPAWAHAAGVYREQRKVIATAGSFRDNFNQWGVHVYHFVEPLKLGRTTPASATVGSRVTLRGRGLAAATAVSFGGVPAHFTIRSDRKLVAKVPRDARSGPIAVTSALTSRESASSFPIRPSPATLPEITGKARVGYVLRATPGTWYGGPETGYTFKWLRCNRHGGDCRVIRGATRSTLTLAHHSIGKRFRVLVVAHAPSGSGQARSAATPVVG
jgi:hypothetical protein